MFRSAGSGPDAFWDAFHDFPKPGNRTDKVQPSTASLEKAVRAAFPAFLAGSFKDFLRAFPKSSDETNLKRHRVIDSLRFSVSSIGYGSLDILTVVENLDKVSEPFGIAFDAITAVLAASAPGALNLSLSHLYEQPLRLPWEIEGEAVGDRGPSTPPQGTAPEGPAAERRGFWALVSSNDFALRLVNALYIIPILTALYVFISANVEMNKRIASYDHDLLAVKTDEIARAAARTSLLDAQEKDRRERLETIYKENADAIRGILSDELKRAAARSDYFDQQQVLLLQRYENLSKDSSETIKALVQKSGSRPPAGEDKPSKDAPPKSPDSK
jgi:hypothetical protein